MSQINVVDKNEGCNFIVFAETLLLASRLSCNSTSKESTSDSITWLLLKLDEFMAFY